jgi:PAS domain S-box-containing protein
VPIERDSSRSRLAAALEQLPAFVAVLRGPEHVFEIANRDYARLVGHRDLLGLPVRQALPEVENQGYFELLDRVYATGEAFEGREMPLTVQSSPGAEPVQRFVNFVYQPLRDDDGRVEGIIAHGVDVTELVLARRTAEEQSETLVAQAVELQRQAARLRATQAELEEKNERLARATREAEESRERLEAVIRQLPSGVVLAEASTGSIILGNDQVNRIWRQNASVTGGEVDPTQYRVEHLDGRPYDRSEWPLARALRGEEVIDEEMAILRGDGTRGVISVSSAPIREPNGEVVGAVAVFDDVTEQWQREKEQTFLVEAARLLSSSLDYHETLASVARLAVPRIADWCAVDVLEDGQVKRLAAVHADPSRERLAREVTARWPVDGEAAWGVPDVIRTGEPVVHTEISDEMLRSVARDEEHYSALRSIGMRSAMILPMVARGRTFGAITFISAESERRYGPNELRIAEKLSSRAGMAVDNALLYGDSVRAREEAEAARTHAEEARRAAEAANRAKSEFLASMSHEIRTPLNAVTGYTELLELGIGGPLSDAQRVHLSRIRKSTTHLLALINDLLDLARIESGRLEVQHEPEVAQQAIEAAVALVGPQAASRGIVVENRCGDDALVYFGDQDRVRQILVNIIGNAVKFTPQGGRVTVSCGTTPQAPEAQLRDPGPWTCIQVSDTGIGIAADQVERIFRPFEQARGGYTREAGGAGLGLAISRQLALLMGGEITVVSEPGKGSTFTLWLPRDAPADLVPLDARPGDAAKPGLAEMGAVLLRGVNAILEGHARKLRSDPRTPMAAALDDAQLKDHQSSLLSDMAATLVALSEASPAQAQLLRDGSEIQRVVADLHGRQRGHLGWSEEALRREFEVLEQEVEALVRRVAASERTVIDVEAGLGVIRQLLDRVQRVSFRALRAVTTGTRALGG